MNRHHCSAHDKTSNIPSVREEKGEKEATTRKQKKREAQQRREKEKIDNTRGVT